MTTVWFSFCFFRSGNQSKVSNLKEKNLPDKYVGCTDNGKIRGLKQKNSMELRVFYRYLCMSIRTINELLKKQSLNSNFCILKTQNSTK